MPAARLLGDGLEKLTCGTHPTFLQQKPEARGERGRSNPRGEKTGETMGERKDKLKGKAKQIVGKATGNRRMEAEGLVLQGRGALRGAAKHAKRAAKRAMR